MNKEEYNKELIHFCSDCLSPAIIWDELEEIYVCKDCGGINQSKASLETWEDKFDSYYGNSYLCIPNSQFKVLVGLV